MVLEVQDAVCRYGQSLAIANVSLSVRKGEMAAVLGPNGAGKSTLLKLISGTAPLSSGRIVFEGQDLARVRAVDRVRLGIAHVPEGRQVFADMTVEENLLLGATIRSKPDLVREQFDVVYDLFPILKARRLQMAGTFSGGEQQMLAIGRGLMMAPRLVLLDEPSLGLAPSIVKDVFRIIRLLRERLALTVIVVEQRVHETIGACDRCHLLASGHLVASVASAEMNEELLAAAYFGSAASTEATGQDNGRDMK